MEKFFIKDSPNVVPSKILNRGKSFNFSEWQSGTIYENTDHKQDFVTYDGQLWGCLETNMNTPPSLDCKEWSLLLTANSVYKFYWKLFEDNEVKPLSFNRMTKLPEKFVPGEIYYIDELQTVAIGTSETECILYDASPEIRKQIDDLKDVIIDNEKVIAKAFSDHQSKISQNSSDIEQIPFKKGTGNNSAVLKGTSNSATNKFAIAFGEQTTASADRAFSEGLKTTASGANSHAEGLSTLAQGQNAHAEGNKCQAIGNHSHAEGNGTIANGGASHAEGSGTITTNNFEHAEGKYNASTKNKTIHSVGIGTSNTDRKNAHEITTDGKHYIYGIGGYDGTNPTESRDLRSVIEPIIIEWDSIKDYANGEGLNNMAELPWLDKTMSGEYQKYNWAIQKDGIIHPCVVIPDLDSNHIQMLFFTRNEIEGTTGPLGNAIMKYSGLRMTTGWDDIYGDEYYKAIYKISNGGSLEVREFVFGENTNKNAYLLAAAQMSKIDNIDCKWVYTDTNGRITNVDAIFTASNNSLAYIDGKGTLNTILFNNDGSYEKNSLNLLDRIYELENIISQITGQE